MHFNNHNNQALSTPLHKILPHLEIIKQEQCRSIELTMHHNISIKVFKINTAQYPISTSNISTQKVELPISMKE